MEMLQTIYNVLIAILLLTVIVVIISYISLKIKHNKSNQINTSRSFIRVTNKNSLSSFLKSKPSEVSFVRMKKLETKKFPKKDNRKKNDTFISDRMNLLNNKKSNKEISFERNSEKINKGHGPQNKMISSRHKRISRNFIVYNPVEMNAATKNNSETKVLFFRLNVKKNKYNMK